MTWNIKDLNNGNHKTPPRVIQDDNDHQEEPLPQRTPLLDSFYQQLEEQEGLSPNLKEAAYMSQVGMIPDNEWSRIRKMMTRGIQPIWPAND